MPGYLAGMSFSPPSAVDEVCLPAGEPIPLADGRIKAVESLEVGDAVEVPGEQENCIVTVHLAYAVDNFHTLIDQDLFLPEAWDQDRERCRAAGIPGEVVSRPKWQIALEQYDRATKNGIKFEWMTFDEGYGRSVADGQLRTA